MKRHIAFLSTCPSCGHPRLQAGYTRGLLRRLIDIDHVIEAYCLACDALWPISTQERAVLCKAVTPDQHETFVADEYVPRRRSAR
jgi:hypothetical protein